MPHIEQLVVQNYRVLKEITLDDWLTEQLSRWHRQSLEVRDRELQLYETNKQLRSLSPDELDQPEVRRRIENQAVAERTNGRRLANLVGTGEDLVQQAMRNPEFGVGHLEKWAEMLQILKDIAANRMPSVADLLKQASQSPLASATAQRGKTPMAGMVRDTRSGSRPAEPKDAKKAPAAVPLVVDRESSQQPPDKNAGQPGAPKSPSQPRLTLPVTMLAGKSGDGKQSAPTDRRWKRPSPNSGTCSPSSRRSPTSSTACSPTSRAAPWSSA